MITYYQVGLARGGRPIRHAAWKPPTRSFRPIFKRFCCTVRERRRSSSLFTARGRCRKIKRPFEGVLPNLERLYKESESEFTRNRLKAFMELEPCDSCGGLRLKPEILAVTLGGPRVPGSEDREAVNRRRSRKMCLDSRLVDHGSLLALGRGRGGFSPRLALTDSSKRWWAR